MLGNLFGQAKVAQTTIQDGQPQQAAVAGSSSIAPQKRHDLSVLSHLDTRTSAILAHAEEEAIRIKQQYIEPQQLLWGLLFDGEIFQLLEQFSPNVSKISTELQSKEQIGNFTGQPNLSDASKRIFEEAYSIAKNHDSAFVSPEHLLVALFSPQIAADTSHFLETEGLDREKLEEKLEKSVGISGKKSILDKYGIDMTDLARKGQLDPISGRDKEIERLVHILLRRSKNNPIIIGEAGVGKTAVVEGFAQKIVTGGAPKELLNRKIIQLELSSLVAGASHRGEFEERLRNVIKETQVSSGQIILFVDEIHMLIGAGDTQGAMDASNIIKPFLARGQLQIIGTTTTSEYRKYFEKDKAFERRFQPILVDEPTEEVAVQMLSTLKEKYEKFHNVVIPDETLKSAVHLSKKYIGERFLPDKAVDLLDEAAADVKLQHEQGKRTDNQIKTADIEKIVSSWTGIPITKLTEDEGQKLLHLESLIHERLIDQEEAVAAISEAVRRGRIGLAPANRPIASFIFLGPTGVGKTELAKTLASILFGREDLMIRLDMSEYMEKHEVAKLIGAPPGYVGYEEGGQLTEAVRRKPYSIVLLDEIEKAHPDVFNILLQLLEDGRLTDNKGNTISFKNTIVVATSNIGSVLIQQQISEGAKGGDVKKRLEELNKVLIAELQKFFKPELLNRFDAVTIFKPLTMEHMTAITSLGIEKTRKLLKEQNFDLSITDGAIARLAQEGYDPSFGARPLRRLIQTAIENPIAMLIIQKTFVPNDVIMVNYDANSQQFTFNKKLDTAQLPQTPPVEFSPAAQPGPPPA